MIYIYIYVHIHHINDFKGLFFLHTTHRETRYTLDRRPWHEVGNLGKNSMFFALPHFRLRRNYCGAALHTLFHHCFESRFSSSKRRSGVAGPRLCLQTHWYTINLMSSDIKVCPPTFEVAFTCCGHQSFLSDRHALSMI